MMSMSFCCSATISLFTLFFYFFFSLLYLTQCRKILNFNAFRRKAVGSVCMCPSTRYHTFLVLFVFVNFISRFVTTPLILGGNAVIQIAKLSLVIRLKLHKSRILTKKMKFRNWFTHSLDNNFSRRLVDRRNDVKRFLHRTPEYHWTIYLLVFPLEIVSFLFVCFYSVSFPLFITHFT